MKISYKPLWKLLIDKSMRKQDLQVAAKISAGSIAKLGKDENITTDVLIKICNALDCDLFDILETIPTDNTQDVTALEQQGEANGR
ncbi:helix-turn-helix domain-containing protein [Arcanobacterium hippocoleae]|nr:helix-turn-helix transcriptional regulator [Arcanobacterium hippocoleae]